MAASDSDSSLSGVDVTAAAVHFSPFRDPNIRDEFDGQEIPFEAPESRDIQVFLLPPPLYRVRHMPKFLRSPRQQTFRIQDR